MIFNDKITFRVSLHTYPALVFLVLKHDLCTGASFFYLLLIQKLCVHFVRQLPASLKKDGGKMSELLLLEKV